MSTHSSVFQWGSADSFIKCFYKREIEKNLVFLLTKSCSSISDPDLTGNLSVVPFFPSWFSILDVCRSNDKWGLKSILLLSDWPRLHALFSRSASLAGDAQKGDLFIMNNKTPAMPAHCGDTDNTKCFMGPAINHLIGPETE